MVGLLYSRALYGSKHSCKPRSDDSAIQEGFPQPWNLSHSCNQDDGNCLSFKTYSMRSSKFKNRTDPARLIETLLRYRYDISEASENTAQ